MKASRSALLVTALLAAAAAAAAAARLPGQQGAWTWPSLSVDICETYDKEACLEHPDKCTPCRAWDRMDLCFETGIAKRLPTKLFQCDFAPEPAPPTPEEPPLTADCQDFKAEGSCSEHSCVWCVSAAVRSACYSEAEARRLPAAVFKCSFPSALP